MGVRFPSVASTKIVVTPIITTADTVVVNIPPLNLPLDFAMVLLFWYIQLLPGAGSSSAFLRLRRGITLTGPQLNVDNNTAVTAGVIVDLTGCYSDTPGAVAGQQYSISVAMIGATANTGVTDVSLIAIVL